MVTPSRAPSRADQLRPLNRARPIQVTTRTVLRAGNGFPVHVPVAIIEGSRRIAITGIDECWLVMDEWWRHPIDRWYWRLALADGRSRTIYHDRIANTWYAQAY
jgi:hypothetical protein